MIANIYPLTLAAIFVVHNVEEYISFDRMPKIWFGRKILNRQSFLFSISVLTVFVLLSAKLAPDTVNTLILFSLAINALQHVALSLWYRKFVAGAYSAFFLMLPFSILYFKRLFRIGELDLVSFVEYLFVAQVLTVCAIWSTLQLGNLLCTKKGG